MPRRFRRNKALSRRWTASKITWRELSLFLLPLTPLMLVLALAGNVGTQFRGWVRSLTGSDDMLLTVAAGIAVGLVTMAVVVGLSLLTNELLVSRFAKKEWARGERFCPACGYNVNHTETPTCPECGAEKPKKVDDYRR